MSLREIKISNLLDRVAREVRSASGDVPLDFYEAYDFLGIKGIPTSAQLVAFRDYVIEAGLRKEEQRIRELVPTAQVEVLGGIDGALERLGWGKK